MDSITKPKLTREQLSAICARHMHEPLKSAEELKDGWFNTAFLLTCVSGREAVLKSAPPDSVRLMRYEENLMHAEVAALHLVKHMTGVPVPDVIAYDTSRELTETNFFLTNRLGGRPLDQVRSDLTEEAQFQVDRQVGAYLKEIHSIQGPQFGTFNRREHSSWPDAFACLMDWLRKDASDLKVELPHRAFESADSLLWSLDEVNIPTFVHWDLWDGNIFVNPESGTVTGLIDFERVLWADPLIEANFGEMRAGFIAEYGNDVMEGRPAQARRLIYDLYLALIMVIECRFRRFATDHETWTRQRLDEKLHKISTF